MNREQRLTQAVLRIQSLHAEKNYVTMVPIYKMSGFTIHMSEGKYKKVTLIALPSEGPVGAKWKYRKVEIRSDQCSVDNIKAAFKVLNEGRTGEAALIY